MEDDQDLVSLEGPGGWKVRRRWDAFTLAYPLGFPGDHLEVSIVMEDGEPRIGEGGVRITPLVEGGIGPDDLDGIDWRTTLREAVLNEAAYQRMESHPPGELDRRLEEFKRQHPDDWRQRLHEEGERRSTEVRRAVDIARRKNGVTRERLDKVVQLFDKGGIKAVQEQAIEGRELSRSYAYQLLARAREELS